MNTHIMECARSAIYHCARMCEELAFFNYAEAQWHYEQAMEWNRRADRNYRRACLCVGAWLGGMRL